jgi:hypothetical protein
MSCTERRYGETQCQGVKKGKLKKYQVTIRKRFAALENLVDNEDINRVWGNSTEKVKILVQEGLGYCE